MRRILITVAYDGTDYCGWQLQPGRPTIEGELNRHLSALLREDIHVIGASRTDSGVHGLCNIAVFDALSAIPADKFAYALNQRLPGDIRIQESRQVERDFHPRKCASRKTYEYRIWNASMENPLYRRYSHFVHTPLDVRAMQRAAGFLTGEHAFDSFMAAGAVAATTVRTIYRAEVEREGSLITIRLQGSGFLYHMVRIIAGTLIEVGKGKRKPEGMRSVLEAADRRAAGPTAPARGLVLSRYEFC